MKVNWLAVAGVLGAAAVIIGAFGAHALPEQLEKAGYSPTEIKDRIATFETGARYHMYSALAMLVLGVGLRQRRSRSWSAANWLLLAGTLVFSGLLYALALLSDDFRWLGMVVPIGGLLMIAGWCVIAVGALTANPSDPPSE